MGGLYQLSIDNEHPEISLTSLWGKVWYENYPAPEYVWQSSAANNEFEPKFSLTPLVFGTLKAALHAMLFAIPLALMGAASTAYFMAPLMLVGVVKLAPALPPDGSYPFLHMERKFMQLGSHIYDAGFQSPNVEAARAMERMGDRCQNIAEYIFYLVYGRDIRHVSMDDAIAEIAPQRNSPTA